MTIFGWADQYRFMKSIPTLDELALADTLAFVNEVRAAMGMNALERLPHLYMGHRGFTCVVTYACVIGFIRDTDVTVDEEHITITAGDVTKTFTMPGSVYWFIARPFRQSRWTGLDARHDGIHSYDKRYNVMDGNVSRYVNTAEEVTDIIAHGNVRWVSDGYADYSDGPNDSICITRRSGESIPLENFIRTIAA